MLLGILKTHSVQNGAVVIEYEWNVHTRPHTHTNSKYYNMLKTKINQQNAQINSGLIYY